MKKILYILAFFSFAFTINAQNNIVKGNGICYTNGVPTVVINTDYHCEVAIDTTTGKIYVYGRDTAGGKWIHYGWPLRETGTTGSPSYTPTDKQSYFAINLGDSLYFYGGGSWGLISGGGGGGVTTNVLNLAGNTMTSTVEGIADTSLVIGLVNGNLSGNTQTININNVTDTMAVIGTNVLTFSSDSIKSSINGINSNAIYLGGYTDTDTQDLSITAGKGTINLVNGGNVTLNDSSATNEGTITYSNTANLGTLLSNTFGQQPIYFAGRGTTVLSDSVGYHLITSTEVDGSVTNEGLIAWNVSANLATLTSNTSGSETLLAAGRNGMVISDSSGYMLFTQGASGGTQYIDTLDIVSDDSLRISLYNDALKKSAVYLPYFKNGGNTKAGVLTLGSNDNYGLNIETNNINRVHIDTSGVMSVGTTTPVAIGNTTMTPAADYTYGNGAFGLTFNSTKNSTSAILFNVTGNTGSGITFGNTSFTSATLARSVIKFSDIYSPTSGNGTIIAAEINNNINATSTWNGTCYGLYVNPTLTSLASGFYKGIYIPYSNASGYGIHQAGALTKNIFAGETEFDLQLKVLEIAAPGTPASTFGYLYEKTDGLLYFKNDAGTEYDLTATGGTSNLSYDATNHEVDISGGGTSATIPLSLADGATEGLASFSATYFDATSGNITPDLTNGLATGSQGGWLSSTDWTTFNNKLSAEVDGSTTNEIQTIDSLDIVSDDSLRISLSSDAVTKKTVYLPYFKNGGNSKGANLTIGTNDANNLIIKTNNVGVATFTTGEAFNLGSSNSVTFTNTGISTAANYTIGNSLNDLVLSVVHGVNESVIYMNEDSINNVSDQFRITTDTLVISIAGNEGTAGYPLTSNGYLLSYNQLTGAGIANNTIDGTKIAMGSDAQGDVLYYNGTDWARLGAGTSGHFLKTQGAGANPVWAAASGGSGDNIYNANGRVDSTRYVQIDPDSAIAIGWFPDWPTINFDGRELGYVQYGELVNVYGRDSVAHVWSNLAMDENPTLQLANEALSKRSWFTLDTNYAHIHCEISGVESNIWVYKDSISLLSKKLFVDVDSLRMKLQGSFGTSGQVLKVGSNGLATWGTDATGGGGLTATDTAYFHHQGGNSYGAAFVVGSNDQNIVNIETNNVTRVSITAGASTGGALTVTDVTANTNTVETGIILRANSSGTAATGLGNRIEFDLESTTTDNRAAASIDAKWADATDATRTGDLVFSTVMSSSTLNECFRIGGNMTETFTASVSNTNTVFDIIKINTNSTGTAAASFGSGILFQGESSTTDNQDMARISTYWTTATHASREAALTFQLGDNAGALAEVVKIDRTTSTGLVSIGTATPLKLTNASITGQTAAGLVITGGAAVGDSIVYIPTSANGTDAQGAHVFKVDNNGSVTAMTIRNDGIISLGNGATWSATSAAGRVLNIIGTEAVMNITRISADMGTSSPAIELVHCTSQANANVQTADSYWDIFLGTGSADKMTFRRRTGSNLNVMTFTAAGYAGIGTTSPTGQLEITQTATATGVLKGIVYTGAVNTNQTLSTEIPAVTFTTAGRQWATGALTNQREVKITQPTYSFVGASTITNASTVSIAGAPIKSTNATITNDYALLIESGAVSTVSNSYGEMVNAQTGGTTNYTAAYSGGSFALVGDAQHSILNLRRAITGTAATELFLDGSAVQAVLGGTNRLWNFEVDLIAVCTAAGNGTCVAGEIFSAKRQGAIKRLNTTTSLVGAVITLGTDAADTNMATAATTITADDTNEALKITWTPPATAGSTSTFRVVATYRLTETSY